MEVLCVTGHFRHIAFCCPNTLEEQFVIRSSRNRRLVQVCPPSHPSHHVIAVGGAEPPYNVNLYDVSTRTHLLSLVGHTNNVWGLATLSVGSCDRFLVSGGYCDSQLLVFDLASGKKIRSLPQPPKETYRIHVVPEWSRSDVFVGGSPSRLDRYDVSRGVVVWAFEGHDSYVNAISAIPSRNLLLSAASDNTVRFWSLEGRVCEASLTLGSSGYSLAYAEDRNLIVVGLERNGIEVWDSRQTKTRLRRFLETAICLDDIDRNPNDPAFFASGGGIKSLAVWNPDTGEVAATRPFGGRVHGVRYLHDRFEERGVSKRLLAEEQERIEFAIQGKELLRIETDRVVLCHSWIFILAFCR